MASESNTWRTESSEAKQAAVAVAALLAGLFLVIGFRNFAGAGFTGSLAGFLLGVVLLVVGVGMLLFGGKQVVTVESKAKRILLEKVGRFGASRKEIRFSEISEVCVGELGDKEGGRVRYHVVAKLKSGKEVALFLGFFEGVHSKPAMEARCRRLIECLRTES